MLSRDELVQAVPHALLSVDLDGWGTKQQGKVRDIYTSDDTRILITTDRVSAFDPARRCATYEPERSRRPLARPEVRCIFYHRFVIGITA